jgi:hypothetical protein
MMPRGIGSLEKFLKNLHNGQTRSELSMLYRNFRWVGTSDTWAELLTRQEIFEIGSKAKAKLPILYES